MIYNCYISVNTYHLTARGYRDAYEMYTAPGHRVSYLELPGRSVEPTSGGPAILLQAMRSPATISHSSPLQKTRQPILD
jgi:hypothetical protein